MKRKLLIVLISVMILGILGLCIHANIQEQIKRRQCEYPCTNNKQEGSSYCSVHSCHYEGCMRSVDSKLLRYGLRLQNVLSNYCYRHTCARSECLNAVKENTFIFCSKHACTEEGCQSFKAEGMEYCSEHVKDLSNVLRNAHMYFYLNSAGGIEFDFSAQNWSNKTIKYVRFKVYLENAVGDAVKADYSNNNYIDVEIIGPANPYGTLQMKDKIIGYCDNVARIYTKTATIIYTDGTSESGNFERSDER